MPHKLDFWGEGTAGAKTSPVRPIVWVPWGVIGPKGAGRPESQVRNLNLVCSQCGASDGRRDQRQGFQKTDGAEIERVDCGKLEAGKPDRKEVSARLPVR